MIQYFIIGLLGASSLRALSDEDLLAKDFKQLQVRIDPDALVNSFWDKATQLVPAIHSSPFYEQRLDWLLGAFPYTQSAAGFCVWESLMADAYQLASLEGYEDATLWSHFAQTLQVKKQEFYQPTQRACTPPGFRTSDDAIPQTYRLTPQTATNWPTPLKLP